MIKEMRLNEYKDALADYDIGENRHLIYRTAEELSVISFGVLRKNMLSAIDSFLIYYPEIIYVIDSEENRKVNGILTQGDIRRQLTSDFKEVIINRSFKSLNSYSQCTKEYLKKFFDENINIAAVPLIIDNVLVGEYMLDYQGGAENKIKNQVYSWKKYKSGMKKYVHFHGINKVFFSDIKEYELKETLQSIGIEISPHENEADLKLIGKNQAWKELAKGNSKNSSSCFLPVFYANCVIYEVISGLSEHGVVPFYFESPKIGKMDISEALKNELVKAHTFIQSGMYDEIVNQLYDAESDSYYYMKNHAGDEAIYLDNGDYLYLADTDNPYFTVTNGSRKTTDTPDNYDNTIHMFGPCNVRGACCSNDMTVASCLQRELNKYKRRRFRVVNYGLGGNTYDYKDFVRAGYSVFKPGDVAVFMSDYHKDTTDVLRELGVYIYELNSVFSNSEERFFFDNLMHLLPKANKKIAEHIFQILKNSEKLSSSEKNGIMFSICKSSGSMSEEYNEYIASIKHAVEAKFGVVGETKFGSIVMNCNPFTNGHRYLITTAAKKCDKLIVFVVEEDKSEFPFADRIELVRKGTADIENVLVVPSGKFMISSVTFPGYFHKKSLQGSSVDASQDVYIFASMIAPNLGITMRFAGSEPFDTVTNSYNQNMHDILPQYGIEFFEIPRISINSEAISASKVRALIDSGKIDEVSELVPADTFLYLKAKYVK